MTFRHFVFNELRYPRIFHQNNLTHYKITEIAKIIFMLNTLNNIFFVCLIYQMTVKNQILLHRIKSREYKWQRFLE